MLSLGFGRDCKESVRDIAKQDGKHMEENGQWK